MSKRFHHINWISALKPQNAKGTFTLQFNFQCWNTLYPLLSGALQTPSILCIIEIWIEILPERIFTMEKNLFENIFFLTFLHAGYFCFFCRLLTFFQNIYLKNTFRVKWFGSRYVLMLCQSWFRSKLFAQVICRYQILPLARKEYITGTKIYSLSSNNEWNLERTSNSS